jgi:hypothetical protein
MYDMDGLAMYDDGMGAFAISPEMLKTQAMAGAAGAGGILLTSAIVQRAGAYLPETWGESTKKYVKAGMSVLIGVLGGNYLYSRNRDAAMGFVGGVVGLVLAQLVEGAAASPYLTTSLSGPSVSESDLAYLDAAVANTSPAFTAHGAGAMNGVVASSRELQAAGVTREVLNEYAPYLS